MVGKQNYRHRPRTGRNGNRNHNRGIARAELQPANIGGSDASVSVPVGDATSSRGRYISGFNLVSSASRGGITKNRQTITATRTAIHQVPKAERKNITAQGAPRVAISNTPTGSKNGPPGSMANWNASQNLTNIVNHSQQSNEVSCVDYPVEPDYDDMHEFMQNSRVTEKITASNGRIRPGRSANSGLVPDSRISPVSESRGEHCEVCLGTTHRFAECIIAPKGFIVGCPMCNSRSHLVDECQHYKKLSMEEKVKLLISDRASFPALLSNEPWQDLLWHYLQREDSVVPPGFPWSKDFCREESCRDSCQAAVRIQEAYDKTGDKWHLAFDPATENLAAIYKNYWEPKGYQWTSRMNDLVAGCVTSMPDVEDLPDAPSRQITEVPEIQDWAGQVTWLKDLVSQQQERSRQDQRFISDILVQNKDLIEQNRQLLLELREQNRSPRGNDLLNTRRH
ncbi:hypothetical protein ACHAP5_005034 [Fusarium lateritium]